MSETLYATFADPNRARKVASDLIALGVKEAEISLLVKHRDEVQDSKSGIDIEDSRTVVPMRGTEFLKGAADSTGEYLRQHSVPRVEKGVDVELNPATSDYPVWRPQSAEDFSSAPPNAKRDYNEGIEKDDYNKNYKTDAGDDMAEDSERAKEALEATPYDDMPENSLRFSRGFNAIRDGSPEHAMVDPDADAYRDTDPQIRPDANAQSVAKAAAQGAGIGLGFGAIAAVASLLIPGLGLVIGGGALAAAAAALATGAGVGAIAGGITGLLREQGVPAESATRYASTYDTGGAVLAVTVTNPSMRNSIEQTIRASDPIDIETHQAYLA